MCRQQLVRDVPDRMTTVDVVFLWWDPATVAVVDHRNLSGGVPLPSAGPENQLFWHYTGVLRPDKIAGSQCGA